MTSIYLMTQKENENYLPLYKGGGNMINMSIILIQKTLLRYIDKIFRMKSKNVGGFAFKNKCYEDYRLVIRAQLHVKQ